MLEQRYSDNDQSRRDVPSFIEPRPPLIQNPFMRPRPQKGTNLLELFEEDSEIEEPELVQVYLRVKPCDVRSNLYEIRSDKCLVTTLDTTTAGHGRRTQHNLSKMYTFSKIFGPDSSQREVFENVVKDNLKKLPDGHSFTLLTYGASGSGKTYTLMGTVSSPGLVPRSLEYVFKLVDAAQQPIYKPSDGGADKLNYDQQEMELKWVNRLRHISAPLRDKYRRMSAQLRNDLTESVFDLANRTKHYVWVSFVEIYNEAVYDLLAPPDRRVKLRIREDVSGNVYVKGATQAFVRSGEEAYDVMVAGKHNLVVAATGVHAQSSRSHCIFTITMLTETEGSTRSSCVRLCDLAGSERARATRNTGARMAESRNINSSLHVLERCLHLLRRNQRNHQLARVPYRESKLTRLLGSGLSGSRGEAVSMVVTLNPAPQYAHETKHVLSLAAVAQDIQINNTMYTTTLESSSTTDTTICSSAEVMKLRADNELLHFELVQAQARNKELLAAMEEKQEESANTMRELVEEAKDMTRQYYEAQLQALRSEMDDMVEEYECRLAKVPAPAPPSVGTPTRYLQTKVSHLMTEIAVLEEKLSAEKLARARAEKEVQHLRSCIEERDEKAFKDSAVATSPSPTEDQEDERTEDNEVILTDSDDETPDPFNESLEPVFKKEGVNISIAVSKQTDNSITSHNETADSFNDDIDKSNDTVKYEDCNETPRNSVDNQELSKNSSFVNDNEELKRKVDEVRDSVCDVTPKVSTDDVEIKVNDKIRDNGERIHLHESVKDFDNSINIRNRADIVDDLTIRGNSERIHLHAPVKDFNDSINVFVNRTDVVDDLEIRDSGDKVDLQDSIRSVNDLNDSVYVGNRTDVTVESESSKLDTDDKLVNESKNNDSGTDFNDDSLSNVKCNEVKISNFARGTYFVQDTVLSDEQKVDIDDTRDIEPNPPKVSENFVSKIIKSLKTTSNSDTSLRQFEQLELASKNIDESKDKMSDSFGHIKILKDKRTYFDEKVDSTTENKVIENVIIKNKVEKTFIDEIKSEIVNNSNSPKKNREREDKSILKDDNTNEFTIKNPLTEKRTYFDNIEPLENKLISDIKMGARNEERSPSIVKDDVEGNYGPSTIKKLLGESVNKSELLTSITKHKVLAKKHDSVDMFEGYDSPQVKAIETTQIKAVDTNTNNIKTIDDKAKKLTREVSNVDAVRKSIEKLVLEQKNRNDLKHEMKHESITIEHNNDITSDVKITVTEQTFNETQRDNTIDEFDNIYKNLSAQRPTEFELLAQETSTADVKDAKIEENIEIKQEKNENKAEEIKYNLRQKGKSVHNTSNDKKGSETEEVLIESHAKCEAKPKTRRTLRLRRKKNQEDENSDQDSDKLKDILNLKKEFSDVTMGLPAAKKDVKDIPSPEKCKDDENLPPLMGIQSCPSKSVTRSRRKLFTPRAEPLEESLNAGESNERVCVPRPSYHRARARRKL